jgi:selenocysteine-specific translation elongation factor
MDKVNVRKLNLKHPLFKECKKTLQGQKDQHSLEQIKALQKEEKTLKDELDKLEGELNKLEKNKENISESDIQKIKIFFQQIKIQKYTREIERLLKQMDIQNIEKKRKRANDNIKNTKKKKTLYLI